MREGSEKLAPAARLLSHTDEVTARFSFHTEKPEKEPETGMCASDPDSCQQDQLMYVCLDAYVFLAV